MSNHKQLSIEELRSFPGFENYTDETIKTLEALSILFYELHEKSLIERNRLEVIIENEN